jgi:hypothetical protein
LRNCEFWIDDCFYCTPNPHHMHLLTPHSA